ncbi:hypothetical protein [Clostridium sp. DL1XJH146]
MTNIGIGVICTILGTLLGLSGFWRNSKNDIKDDSRQFTRVESKLDYVSKGVDDIRLDIKAQDRKISDVVERVVRVEESTKSAHHRLDEIEK